MNLNRLDYNVNAKVKTYVTHSQNNFISLISKPTRFSKTNATLIDHMRRNFSLCARYSLKFTRCSLLVVKSLVTRCKIRSLLVAEVARCKKSLITRRRSCSLQKITRYSLQNALVTRWRSCSLQKVIRYLSQNSLVTHCRNCSMQKVTGYSLQNLLVTRGISCSFAKNYSSLVIKNPGN